MIVQIAVALGCLVGGVGSESPAPAEVNYETLKASTGRDAPAQVQLALWCEAHGLEQERVKHLAIAVLTDPSNALARGMLGLVEYHGKWTPPDDVAKKVEADAKLSEKLAEYNTRRSAIKARADDHYALALWCEANGLKPEATVHFMTVTRLEPSREVAWKHLGCRKYQGAWMSKSQILAIQTESEAQKQADRHWKPLFEKYKTDLVSKRHTDRALKALAEVNDPRAVASIWAVFGKGNAATQRIAAGLLGQIDGPVAARGLAYLAVFGSSAEVRRVAHETLVRRDPRDVVDLLISLIRLPIKFELRPTSEPGSASVLFVEGQKANSRISYENPTFGRLPIPARLFAPGVPYDPYASQAALMSANFPATQGKVQQQGNANQLVGDTTRLALERDGIIAQRLAQNAAVVKEQAQQVQNRIQADVQTLVAMNETIAETNQSTLTVLKDVTNQDLGDKPEPWKKWWTDQKGYAYMSPEAPTDKPTYDYYVVTVRPSHSCFVAGTPVRTLTGLRPIETLQAGDQVFVQNTKSGAIQLQPIVATYHNPPNQTYRVSINDEVIAATGIHRFWKVNKGWVMARDLKSGDVVRTLGSTAKVSSVVLDSKPRLVYNLEVAEGRSFFVGQSGLLVHDNSLVEATPDPFDAGAGLAVLKK